ncbi:transcriptional regulator [Rhodospirillum rubrum]|uniref:helix-turn-helix transcriptional regulator n=1 Tax=Rhodospirillum rubrum TaxID=1085 RepID=UPI00190884EE|nr:helix-turn-helix transcriptional regulator [Rhodospirillum rubrum]MBK1666310.1 transcriptional regulator [Rhodospirillum rubrum]MBK1678494.1 transcriptional regulator [Rhodospirillum rubrum]
MSNTQNGRLERTRTDLGEFLRRRRESLSPLDVGLPPGRRRRTPGLRREEVAALAGVGLSWYTWLEQGRAITVSVAFLDNVSRVLKLDETERRHLFVLAHHRPPAINGRSWCVLPPLVRRLIDDLVLRPCYVLNLRWDVIGWNRAADRLFGFEARDRAERNMLWMLFSDDSVSARIVEWTRQAPQILASFRRDYAQAADDEDMIGLVTALEQRSPAFRDLWRRHDAHGRCQGRRGVLIDGIGAVAFDHSTFLIDEEKHLRLVTYAALAGEAASERFERLLQPPAHSSFTEAAAGS